MNPIDSVSHSGYKIEVFDYGNSIHFIPNKDGQALSGCNHTASKINEYTRANYSEALYTVGRCIDKSLSKFVFRYEVNIEGVIKSGFSQYHRDAPAPRAEVESWVKRSFESKNHEKKVSVTVNWQKLVKPQTDPFSLRQPPIKFMSMGFTEEGDPVEIYEIENIGKFSIVFKFPALRDNDNIELKYEYRFENQQVHEWLNLLFG